jgi:protein-disulfide isomerase
VRSKGGGGTRARQASPRALAIGGGVALVAVVVVVLVVVLSGGSKSNAGSGLPSTGSATSARALPGAVHVRNLFKGIPQSGLVLGSPNAPATLTEYIDLQCPVCQEFESTQLDPLINKYVRTGKLNIKMQPWSIRGPDSNRGQSATISAANQNRAFQFAQLLYLNQGQENTGWLNDDMVNAAAASVDGMKVQQVSNDEGSSSVKSIVSSVDNSAAAQGFNATPTLLLNHKGQKPRVASVGLPTLASLESQIQSAIAG